MKYSEPAVPVFINLARCKDTFFLSEVLDNDIKSE